MDTNHHELLRYLRNKVEKGESNSAIPEMDLFKDEPWLLEHADRDSHPRFLFKEWLYFIPSRLRERRRVLGRDGESEVGYWRDRGGKYELFDKDDGYALMGYMQDFVYYKTEKGDTYGDVTLWHMREYSLVDAPWVLCRLRLGE